MPYTDEELVRRVCEGDVEAYGGLVERYQHRLVSAAHHLTGDMEAARDAVRETFIAALGQIQRLRNRESVGAWLYAILRRRAHAWRGRKRPEVSWEGAMMEARHGDTDALESIELNDVLRQLPVQDREMLAARYLLDLSYEEIAGSFRMTAQNVRVRVCRAKERLRAMISAHEKEVGL